MLLLFSVVYLRLGVGLLAAVCTGSEGVVRSPVPLFWVATGSADLGLDNNIQ